MKRVASVVSLAFAVVMASIAANAATLALGDASLSGDQLTVPVTVSGSSGGTLELYIGEAGPKDGNPSATVSAATLAISSDGDYNLTAQISVGAKIAYKAVLGSDESATGTITATDDSEYIWVNNATGLWSNPDNWTRKKTSEGTDTYKNIGYPAYTTGQVRFNGNQTAEVTVDADYPEMGDLRIDNPGLSLTLIGNGCSLSFGNAHAATDNTIVLDNIRLTSRGAYTVAARSTTRLINGSVLRTNWETNVNGTDAYLYVGPDCEVYASYGYWWTFRLDGANALVEVDDGYIHSRGFRIGGQNGGSTPKGFVIKGKHPKIFFQQEFIVCSAIPSNPVFEFVVPRGGYTEAPIQKTADGNFALGSSTWQDHNEDANEYPGVAFTVNEYSPFYQDDQAFDACVLDWSASTLGIRDGHVILQKTSENSPTDYLYFVKANANGETSQDQVWIHLTGTGTPTDLPRMSSTAQASTDSSTGKVTISSSIESYPSDAYTTTVELWLAAGGPKDDPASSFQKVATKAITAAGDFSFEYNGVFGTKIFYKLVCVADNGDSEWSCGATAVQNVVLADPHNRRYRWADGASGVWSDPANWTLEGADDGLQRIGYPTWGADAGFYYGTDVVTIDADYENIHEIILGWGGSDLTFKSDTDGTVRTIETGGFREGQYANVKVSLDAVSFASLGNKRPGSYHIKDNSSLRMYNGACVDVQWEFTVEGQNAYLYIGTNCQIRASVAEPYHRFGLSGSNAEVVIDGGTIETLYLAIAKNGDTANAPKGITFSGKNPRLLIRDNMANNYLTQIYSAINASPVFTFVIPEDGFESTPIVRTGNNGNTFFGQDSEGIPAVTLKVDRSSPYLKVRGNFTQQLVDWSTSSAATKLNTDGVAFGAVPRVGEFFYFTPTEGEAKSGIAVSCLGSSGIAIIVR